MMDVTFKAFKFDGDRRPSSYDIKLDGRTVEQIWVTEGERFPYSWAGTVYKYIADAKSDVKEHYNATGEED